MSYVRAIRDIPTHERHPACKSIAEVESLMHKYIVPLKTVFLASEDSSLAIEKT